MYSSYELLIYSTLSILNRHIWEYNKRPKAYLRIMSVGFVLDTLSILYGCYLLLSLTVGGGQVYSLFVIIEALASIALGVFNMGKYVSIILLNRTIEYRITDNGIRFEWGWIWKDDYFLNFENIKAISLIKYESDVGSILFHTEEHPGFTGYDWKNKVFRSMPSIERIEHAESTFELIERKWDEMTGDFPSEGIEESEIMKKINEGIERKRWMFNRNIGRTYGLIFLIITLFYIDNRVLQEIHVVDKIEWIDYRMNTLNGHRFRKISNLQKGDVVSLSITPVYGNVKLVSWRYEGVISEKHFGLWGPFMFFYFFAWLSMLVSSLKIFLTNGQLNPDLESSYVLGPAGIFVISLLFYYGSN